MGRMTRWFHSAAQAFRACVGRRSAQIDVQKEQATKKKRSYRLWVFRIKRKDRGSLKPVVSPSATTSTTESTRDVHEAAAATPLKPALKRLGEDVVTPGCSQTKEVTFGEKVQVKVFKVKAAPGFLRDAPSEDLHYERTDIDDGVNVMCL